MSDQTEDLPAQTESYDDHPMVKVETAATGMEAFNRLLWQLAKTIGILALILLMVFIVVMMWTLAETGVTTL